MKTNFKYLTLILGLAIATSAFVNPSAESEDTRANKKLSFAEFLSHFNKVDLGYEVGLRDFKITEQSLKSKQVRKKTKLKGKYENSGLIQHLYQVEHGMYSRMGPPEILPVARFYPNDKTVAVVYIPYRPFGYSGYFEYKLAFFDLRGNALPRTEEFEMSEPAFVLGHSRLETAATFRIDQSGQIVQSHFQKVYRDDINKKGPVDNEVVNYKFSESKVFQWNPQEGAVVELEQDLVAKP